jgi:plastocyanin
MANKGRRRLALIAMLIVIAILSGAVLYQIEMNSGSPPQSGSSVSSSSASITSTISTTLLASSSQSQGSASSTSQKYGLLVAFSPGQIGGVTYPNLFLTPSVTMNYSIIVTQLDPTVKNATLSAVSQVPGVSATFAPNKITFLGTQETVILSASVDAGVIAGSVPVSFIANTSKGVENFPFTFTVEKALVVIGGSVKVMIPSTLNVKVGQPVKFLDLNEIDDDGNGYVNVTIENGLAKSPTLSGNGLWTYSFSQPGTYSFQVSVLGRPGATGKIIVA